MNGKTDLKNIVIICLQGIGNTFITLYAAEKFLELHPARLSIVVSNNGSHELALSQLPENRVYIWDESKSAAKNIMHLGWELRQKKFHKAYLAYPSFKREGAIGLMARAKEKEVLLDGVDDWRFLRRFYKSKKLKPPNTHNINANCLLFDIHNQGYICSGQALIETAERNYGSYAEAFFEQHGLLNKFIIAIHPGAKGEGKRWDTEKFIQLCNELSKKFDCKFVVIGGDDELLVKQKMARGIGERAILLNSSSFLQTGSVLKKCNLFIGNDSAPMHLSATLGVPVIALWGYTNFYDTSPYGPGNVIIRKAYNCSPCYSFIKAYRNDCDHSMRCIKKLASEEVLPIASRWIETMLCEKRSVTLEDINSLKDGHIERTYKLEHGCIVIDLEV